MQKTVTIGSRFNGPPKSGNGGYSSGLIASLIDGPAEASLHVPPPLDKPLSLSLEDGVSYLRDGDRLIGLAKPVTLSLDVPALPAPLRLGGSPVSEQEFEPFDNCFVCGTARTPGDGLCIHSRIVETVASGAKCNSLKQPEGVEKGADVANCNSFGNSLVGSIWTPDVSLAGPEGQAGMVDPVYIWAALDCPGYYATVPGRAALLGRLTAEILAPLPVGEAATVLAWSLGGHGRKHRSGTAIYGADGTLVAKAEGLWITIDPSKLPG
ncbi:MAG: hypothetical protein EP335_07105 [Alphaproteobacteria bacterium]|nr:MAG: hypothetical protein EP335_07105 [Alphaproteobacteria bacterium]